MRKLLNWLDKYLLEIGIGFLLIFIPLYPKFPLIDIKNTWVYIRVDDFAVALVAGIWLIQLARKKVSLKTPLTVPIIIYWLIGGISLIHAIFILSNQILHFFPGLGLLHYFRRVEYMLLFFIASASVKNIQVVKRYLAVIALALVGVCLYGFGQKFLGFPAFLTMNEEFAKGLPLYLPLTARMTSTFAGHYDLAAFLIFMIVLWGSLIFGFKNWLIKILILGLVFASFILLLFTASRISFMVYLVAISSMLLLQKKKLLILPVIFLSLFLSSKVTGSAERFGKTFRIQQVVYDTRTGLPIATVQDFFISPTPTPTPVRVAKKPAVEVAPAPPTATTEENLPLGSGYFSLEGLSKEEALAQIIRRPIFAKSLQVATMSSEIATESGEFLVKRAIVYDISFTTRIQGEWPRAMTAFKRNRLLGSGFSSISLATDNDYLRLLGETGLAGFFSFLSILAVFALIVRLGLRRIKSALPRSILIGVLAGLLGLLLNAVLIDVFEASKVAYVLWMTLGITVGLIQLLVPEKKNLLKEATEVIKQPIIIIFFLFLLSLLVFGSSLNNYFSGDDFTWLRWAFSSRFSEIPQFFISAQGFFYRPLAKAYFLLANPFFGLRPYGYHLVSLLSHFGSAVGAFLLLLLLTKNKLIAFLSSLFFLIHPINAEAVFWISTTSHLFAGLVYIWGFLAYILWRTSHWRGRGLFLVLTIIAYIVGLTCHEMMVTFPFVIILYDLIFEKIKSQKWHLKVLPYLPFGVTALAYFWVRDMVAQALGLSGDYNYNLKNLVFNFFGNLVGYLGELSISFHFIPVYDFLRLYLKSHKLVAVIALIFMVVLTKKLLRKINFKDLWSKKDFRLVIFAFGWLIIVLLPFIGLGNIAERYLHTAQLGFFIILALAINKIYCLIKKTNWRLAIIVVFIITLGLSGFYLRELNQAKADWYRAGEIANKILLALPTTYPDFPSETNLYFVNLPLRVNRAWVFPVGLKDGLWFIYRNDTIRVYQMNDIDEALDLAEGKTPGAHVFLYFENELKEVKR